MMIARTPSLNASARVVSGETHSSWFSSLIGAVYPAVDRSTDEVMVEEGDDATACVIT
jgi:hypothetical protein